MASVLPHVWICRETIRAFRCGDQRRVKEQREEGEQRETYQTAAGLRVAAGGVTVALTPLTGAQVKARGGPSVAVLALLQTRGK